MSNSVVIQQAVEKSPGAESPVRDDPGKGGSGRLDMCEDGSVREGSDKGDAGQETAVAEKHKTNVMFTRLMCYTTLNEFMSPYTFSAALYYWKPICFVFSVDRTRAKDVLARRANRLCSLSLLLAT